jgi:formamidopyrimidine-DNA glycosylase
MPELPEVEFMVNRLQKYVGMTIHRVSHDTSNDRYLPEGQHQIIIGQQITGIFRRGKFMVFTLDKGALVCHNAMSGYWDSSDEPWTFDYVEGDREPSNDDIRAIMFVGKDSDSLLDTQALRFHDTRKFGYLKYFDPETLAEKLSSVGPEIIKTENCYEPTDNIGSTDFTNLVCKMKKPIKQILMEQKIIAGVGNIYAAEACYFAKVDPRRPAKSLSTEEIGSVFEGAQRAMRSALDRKLDYSGLNVYRRKNCPRCNITIMNEDLKGRSTYWCPSCQK